MWDWLRRRTGLRRPRNSTLTGGENTYSTDSHDAARPLRQPSHPFFVPTLGLQMRNSPPKCLSHMPCSQILYGARLDDFASDCWLEDHLHRFGLPDGQGRFGLSMFHDMTSNQTTSPLYEEDEESTTDSSESDATTIEYSQFELDIHDTFDLTINRNGRPALALEELFIPPGERCLMMDLSEPPPYTQFPDDPPPSYEEALAQMNDRRSSGTRSSSSSLAFMW